MSRAFMKERDDAPEPRIVALLTEPCPVTAAGLVRLRAEAAATSDPDRRAALEAQVTAARANARKAESDLARARELAGKQIISRPQLDAAADRLIAAMRAWVGANTSRLAAIELAPETAAAILEDMVRGWETSREPVTTLEAPPELIARYPAAKDLLAPG